LRDTAAVQPTASRRPPLPGPIGNTCERIRAGEDLRTLDLRGADFAGLAIDGVDFSGADLSGASFARSRLRRVRLDGCSLVSADFRSATLRETPLERADARGSRFARASLGGADCRGSVFVGANFRDASLRGADLTGCDLTGADLRGADLRDARLGGAVLTGARTSGASFAGAELPSAVLGGVDFAEAAGLDRRARARLRDAGAVVGWPGQALLPRARRLGALTVAGLLLLGLGAQPLTRAVVEPLVAGGAPASPMRAPAPPSPDPTIRVAGVSRHLRAAPLDFADASFESGRLAGWGADGAAFEGQPICASAASTVVAPEGADGRCFVASHLSLGSDGRAASQGDDPTGTLTSGPFPIEGGTLTLRLGGGKGPNTRVELLVDGSPTLEAHGQDDDVLREVRWDLEPFRGREGRICLVDLASGSFGRIEVDAIRIERAGAAITP
jgi:uncharacterized protein YjbI with pentapeptide repeats